MALYCRTVQGAVPSRQTGANPIIKEPPCGHFPLWRKNFPAPNLLASCVIPRRLYLRGWRLLSPLRPCSQAGRRHGPQLSKPIWPSGTASSTKYAFFKSGRVLAASSSSSAKHHDNDRIVIQFRPFIKQQLSTMRDLYEGGDCLLMHGLP